MASLRHRPYEDVQALLTGTLFVALGVVMFGYTGLLTGGTVGIAFLVHYATGWNFGLLLFLINLPFYALAWRRMGRAFTLKTFAAVGLLSILVNVLPRLVSFESLSPPFTAVMGGLLMGAGMLMLFRHRASLGGLQCAGAVPARALWLARGPPANGAGLRDCVGLVCSGELAACGTVGAGRRGDEPDPGDQPPRRALHHAVTCRAGNLRGRGWPLASVDLNFWNSP